jgi:uncharacterized protein (DUF1800 family)
MNLKNPLSRWLSAGLFVTLFVSLAHAVPVTLWQIGEDEDPFANGSNPSNEFANESGNTNAAPGLVTRLVGDPLYNAANNPRRDDHFYQAGTYPVGFNSITTTLVIPNSEPVSVFERALTDNDPTNQIHFILNAAQSSVSSRLRLSFELVNGGSYSSITNTNGDSFGIHNVEVRFRTATSNTLILQRAGVDRSTRFTIDIPAKDVNAVAGANTIQIIRSGPTPAIGVNSYVQFDFVKMEVDSDGMTDGDGDGLPRWWEKENGLNDSSSADATADEDGDGLTALQEYHGGVMPSDPHRKDTDGDGATDAEELTASSNPNLLDTDGDGLNDNEEILISPKSSPILTDTDNDGAPDAWEKRVGSNPNSATSKPTVFAGAIGLNFVCSEDSAGSVPWLTPAGVVPQLRWNNTLPLRNYSRPSGSTQDIISPAIGAISKANGQAVPGMTVQWTSEDNSNTSNNGSANQKLLNGYLRAYQNKPVTLTVQGIPFTKYHIFAYVGGNYDGQQGSVKLNDELDTNRLFYTASTAPRKDLVEIKPLTLANPIQNGNYVRYQDRTSASFTLNVTNLDGYSLGLHGIQIVDATLDDDNSGIPDWYEMQYALEPVGTSTASADPDGDGLTNLQEFQRGSDPRKADTDGDGLLDSEESKENALNVDSDGDGLSDAAELKSALPSNPNIADTDGDGIADKKEVQLGLDPSVNPASTPGFLGWVPVYSASPAKWEWKIDPIQVVWDHGGGATGGGDGNEDTLLSFSVGNVQSGSRRSISMDLRSVNGVITYQFESHDGQAFSAANNPTSNIYLIDGNRPRTDLKSALGFSGYGSADISDKLRFRLLASRGSSNSWTVSFEIFNITKNTIVISRLVTPSTAGALVDAGTTTWQDSNDEVGIPTFRVHEGVKLFITPTALESLPAFAAFTDKDNDGMPDLWEDANLLNKNSAADAILDADSDGLKNRDEYLNGTNPRLRDTDGDGVDDRIEHDEGTNPLAASLRPIFADGATSSGTDFNQNGFPDAWEARFKATGLTPNADSDGDGASNAKEAVWGTDPFDGRSGIGLTLERSGNDALLAWTRSPWKKQQLYRSTNLASWQSLSVSSAASGINDTARLSGQFTAARSAFFAMETLDKDSDGDGISDWDEMMIGSDPYIRDSSRSSSLTLDSLGNVTGSVSGDYAAFTANFKNALTGGNSQVSSQQAARFLQQASFGPTMAELDRVQNLGFAGWINDQITAQPASYQQPILQAMVQDLNGPKLDLSYSYNNLELNGNNAASAFARSALSGTDQLRQRVAFALSQILVASRRDANLADRPLAMANFYDIFIRHAFGNYRDILGEVSKHAVMGRYLSHVGNQKARPEINQFPDENYAREVMQLFTIGLWKLNQDGTRKLDASGNFIPTYGNSDITEMARVFTGFWFGGQRWSSSGGSDVHLTVPMEMWAEKHDFGSKSMLGGLSLPARAASAVNGLRDVDAALDFLFNDSNTAPFISRQLIQFLVTSNPSPAYVGRVAAIFANNGNGKRGDLAAVVRAILLDIEARDVRWSRGSTSFGRLKDPVYRAMSLARVGRLGRFPALNWWDYGDFYESSLQSPGAAPSVFNFYRPDYRSPGLLTDNQLAAPALQITNSYTSIAFVNRLWQNTVSGIRLYDSYIYKPDYRDLLEVAATPTLLVDRVNLLLCGGMMSASTRASILNALSQVSANDLLQRAQLTVFLASACPEGAVQR